MFYFLIINFFIYLLILKLSYKIFKMEMYYPFRKAEIYAFIIINIISNILILYLFSFYIVLVFVLLNSLLFYIIYHTLNMIQTSPRTKILLDLYDLKNININKYISNDYSTKKILDNRLLRFQSSNQIYIDSSKIYLYGNRSIFIKIIFSVFKLIKFF